MPEMGGKISGTQRAAILLMTLGEQDAAEVLKHMGPKEVQKLGAAMAALTNISRMQVGMVLHDFVRTVEHQTALGIGADDYVRKVLTKALGEDKASGLIDRILGSNAKGLEALKWMEPRAVMELIRSEHPQIVAIVLSYLESDQAAAVLALFPEKLQADVLLRIASLDSIQPAALQELNRIIERGFSGRAQASGKGGVRAAAGILNLLKAPADSALMTHIKEGDAALAQKIEDLMVMFEDLLGVDDLGIQALLREASSESLLLALKGADEAMKEKIFKNMSKRAAEMMRDDLEAKGPVRLSEVEAAQKEILKIARRMANAGELMLGGGNGGDYV